MTAFPSIYNVMRDGYDVVPRDGAVTSRADDGTLRVRRLWSETRVDIAFNLDLMSKSDFAALAQFYESYKYEQIEWTDQFTDTTYDVLMLEPPRITERHGPWVRARVVMEGTAQ